MTDYRVEFTSAAARQVRKLDPVVRRRLLVGVGKLAHDPRPANSKPLVGASGVWRIRIGEYRVIYTILDRELIVTVVRAGHRRDIYDSNS